MPVLIATKPMRYSTRHLVADDPFEASDKDAKLLKAIRKARDMTAEEAARYENREAAPPAKVATAADAAGVLAQVDQVSFFQFKALAAGILGAETPSTKAEIIAALENRAGASS